MKDILRSIGRSIVKGALVGGKVGVADYLAPAVAPALDAVGIPGSLIVPVVTFGIKSIYDQAKRRVPFLAWLP